MILMIDNYDSFTYNLVQMLQKIGEAVRVCRNDQIDLLTADSLRPSAIVISPGPGNPGHAGISVEAVRHFGPKIPIFGVCLGHQSIAEAFGGKVVRANRIMHGKTSLIFHDGRSIYQGLPNPLEATRYHSLIVDARSLPDCLEISAWTKEGEIMGLRHRKYQVEGVQFHPESILTSLGHQIMRNFILKKEEFNYDQGGYSKGSQRRRLDRGGDGKGHGGGDDWQSNTGTDRLLYHGPQNKGGDRR
ncbi:MAG: anthranilate/aminodeoxychorismate synthase component II [Deltaproteobacteria bacterium]|nr:MAG: anthranilate/aminodeoxychorismate synthase component II [Deltaproteobacteria bacterium]